EDAPTLQDIAAVIAGANAYVGASLHGHITAAAYDTPARVVTVPALHKFPGQARPMGRADELVTDWSAALAAFPKVLSEQRRTLPPGVARQLQDHWSRVAGLVRAGAAPDKPMIFGDAPVEDALRAAVQQQNMPSSTPQKSPPEPDDPGKTGKSGMTQDVVTDWDNAQINRLIATGDLGSATTWIDAALDQRP
ncbi:unnamed protein product, partial [Ectocarpus sp. 12 AP-2014]